MNLNISGILNNISGGYKINSSNSSAKNKVDKDSQAYNIFAKQAKEMVADYKAKQEESSESNSSSSSNLFGMSAFSIANMSTKDFLNYAYNNRASSGFDKEQESDENNDIKLPMMVRYKTKVVSTSGKSFMAVVAKLHGMFPHHTEEEIATELLAKYSNSSSNSNKSENNKQTTSSTTTTTNSLDLSA